MAGPGTGLAVALPSTPTSTVEVVSAVVVRLMIAAANFNYELESTTHWHGGGGGDIWRGDFEWVLPGLAGRVGRIPGRGSRQPEHRDSDNLECGPGRNSVVTVTTHTRNGACQSTAVGWMEKLVPVGTDDPQILGMHGLIVVVVATAVLFSVQVTAECANACFGHGECSVSACTQRWGQGAGCRVQRLLVRQASLADQLDATQPT